MRRHIQTLTLALAIALAGGATSALAQQGNPFARNAQHDSFYYGAIKNQRDTISSPLGPSNTNELTRPTASFGPVTPVPEPSEWAMLLAGLALVGFIVRRNAKRS
jgi:hypothetical protein